MVMGRRPGVERSSWPVAVTDLAGLLGQMSVGLARVPFRRPWSGQGNVAHNLAVATTREVMRTFMGYTTSLPIDEFRSVELVLDDLCGVVLPPIVDLRGVDHEDDTVGGVLGEWFRPRTGRSGGTALYLHGGGYVGTSPRMYSVFMAWMARRTGCDIFVPDLRLAPEFPFPADLEDAAAALHGLLASGVDAASLVLAGDSSGGGLVTSLVDADVRPEHLPVAAVVLFSPEVNLQLDCPSVRENAHRDILPWNIPTTAYLDGVDPSSPLVSATGQDLDGWPPTFVSIGGDEMFRDAIRRFSFHLDEADVDAEVHEEPGMFHVYPILMPWSDAGRRTVAAAGEFVRHRLPAADAVSADDGVSGPADAGGSQAPGADGGPVPAGAA
jgi:acetyl esterase/lipase